VIEATLIAEIDHVLDIALKVSENLDPNNVSEDEGDNKIGVSFGVKAWKLGNRN